MRRLILAVFATASVAFAVTACSPAAAGPVEVSADTVWAEAVVLDVRTAEEYADGHLDGARLLDFNAGEVQAAIPTLDPEAEYVVYCRSGSRAGQAIALMEQAGFANVTNLGSLEQAASATGMEIVR